MNLKQLRKKTILTAYDNCDKYTLLEWLKCIDKELDAKQLKITKANEGEGILLTFKDGELDKISADVTEEDINALVSQLHELEIEVDGKQTKLRAGQNITIYHDEETGEDVISATGGGGGIELLVKARYEGEGSYIVQTSGLYSFIYAFYGQERRLPNIVMTILGSETQSVNNENILFTYGERIHVSDNVDIYKFYARVENDGVDAYYSLLVSSDEVSLSKTKYDYQPKTDNALTTESNTIVGAINEHEIKINTHNTRLNGLDISVTQLSNTKQDKQDNDLQTTSKNVVGAINEVNAKAEGSTHAYVISTANGKNPNFLSDDYTITASQIELQDGTIVLIADIKEGTDIYVLEENVSDRWYSGSGNFIKLTGDKPILDDYQLKATLDDDVEELGYIKSVSFSQITGSATDNVSLQNALLQKENKADLDTDVSALGYVKESTLDTKVSALGYIKGITQADILEILEGSKFISIDEDEESEKLVISFDFTNIDKFITFASGQDIVASWTNDKQLQLNINNTLKNKINNSLQLPTTHTEETLVGVDTTGGQEQVGLDNETMEIVNGKLRAKIPTIPHLYNHHLALYYSIGEPGFEIYVLFNVITNNNTQFTFSTLRQYLETTGEHICSGRIVQNNITYILYSIKWTTSRIGVIGMKASDGTLLEDELYTNTNVTDIVTQII